MPKKKTALPKKANDFESSLRALERIVESLEEDDVRLETSLKSFEEGVLLIRDCVKRLDAAEQKIEMLIRDDKDGYHTETFPSS